MSAGFNLFFGSLGVAMAATAITFPRTIGKVYMEGVFRDERGREVKHGMLMNVDAFDALRDGGTALIPHFGSEPTRLVQLTASYVHVSSSPGMWRAPIIFRVEDASQVKRVLRETVDAEKEGCLPLWKWIL